MTKSTITREQLEEWVAQFDEDGGCDATDRQLEALIRQSLAAMDGEPVAEVLSNRPGNDTSTIDRALPVGTQLYRHAQQPVVPEEATPDSIGILASARRRDHAVFQWDEDQRNAAADSWNAFRAAMLQELKKSAGTEAICRSDENVQVLHTKSPAQSDCCPAQNSVTPAQNQGWIPVSERMPENDGAYLCWDNRYVTTYAFIFGAWQANQFIAKNITHWMPLPAGPQEVR